MNVFILCAGRTGSSTFIKACKHIQNYSAAHESLSNQLGVRRLGFPENHIEADNRLIWFLGKLDKLYGDNAYYVHLQREETKVAASFSKRYFHNSSIIRAYINSILVGYSPQNDYFEASLDYVHTANSNIRLYLKDKNHKMDFSLENVEQDFPLFWENIHAEGNIELAMNEWQVKYNATNFSIQWLPSILKKAVRIIKGVPNFIKYV